MRHRGEFVAVKRGKVTTRRGDNDVYKVAFIPERDPDGFPRVLNVSLEVYNNLTGLRRGDQVVLDTINTPPYNEELVVAFDVETDAKAV